MNVVIAAGGTGGHFYPAIALAEEFRRRDVRTSVTLIGTGRALEQLMMAGSDIKIEPLQVRGVVGRGLSASMQALWLVPGAIWKAMKLLRGAKADLVIGTGGYTSPPVVIAAWLLGIKRVLLEPNAIPGVANRVLGPFAHRVFVSFEHARFYFNPSKVRVVGAPIRKAFVDPPPVDHSGEVKTVLVCGGSQGASAINTAMIEAVKKSDSIRTKLILIHQTGTADLERVQRAYAEMNVQAEIVPFVKDMPQALRAADLVISRCGALTLAEIAASGKPAVLIPFPSAAHQHQEHNARVIEQAGAGVMLLESESLGERLAQVIESLVGNQGRVRSMSQKSLGLRKTDSAEVTVQECEKLVAGC
ncbi:MAG: undecaprenyldiphospho-muramoylpentapeptide beta-N-acetylglucosaminyltransferase [Nitrospirae bacterium]|nr:undecaprenyldiphospho-muramoylpentapeptide beta-N-acetylglucosaminyltransferase [Nitrospirota bacterium]MDA1303694.1 undecaprenyldiphospho-muramoylpentapeptide beta-N-acetylglucosaminyltransferase [Nitrospirota bacterium]